MNFFNDPHGNFSVSKFWTNVAYAVATYVVVKYASSTNWELLLVYLSVVGGSEMGKKFLNMKYGNMSTDPQPSGPVPKPPPPAR